MKYKRLRDELEKGDKVVYVYPGYAGTPTEAYEVEVVKVTKTRVVVVHPEKHHEEAFMKSSGRLVGGNGRYSSRIEVGERAEHALVKGRENMKRSEITSILMKAENSIKNDRIPLSEVVHLLESALAVAREDVEKEDDS